MITAKESEGIIEARPPPTPPDDYVLEDCKERKPIIISGCVLMAVGLFSVVAVVRRREWDIYDFQPQYVYTAGTILSAITTGFGVSLIVSQSDHMKTCL